jgi:hypothetical protein
MRNTSQFFWSLPLVDNEDPVVSLAAREYVRAKRGAPYTLTAMLCHLSVRVPVLRAQLAAAKRQATRRVHDAAVSKLQENRVAA